MVFKPNAQGLIARDFPTLLLPQFVLNQLSQTLLFLCFIYEAI